MTTFDIAPDKILFRCPKCDGVLYITHELDARYGVDIYKCFGCMSFYKLSQTVQLREMKIVLGGK